MKRQPWNSIDRLAPLRHCACGHNQIVHQRIGQDRTGACNAFTCKRDGACKRFLIKLPAKYKLRKVEPSSIKSKN